jgi:malyl-CoA/(S)-citramalyl-CoA lyase
LTKSEIAPFWPSNPSQVQLANEVFRAGAAEVAKSKHILAAKAGKGAVSLDGRLIDYASIRQAEVLVKKAEQIGAAG